jgi:hypothetical protein
MNSLSYKENTCHAVINGKFNNIRKLNDKSVKEIRCLYKRGNKNYNSIALSKLYGVNRTTIMGIVSNKFYNLSVLD